MNSIRQVVQRSLADPEAQAAWAALIEDEKRFIDLQHSPLWFGEEKSCSQSRRRHKRHTAQRAHANVSPRRDVIPRDRWTNHDAARPFNVKVLSPTRPPDAVYPDCYPPRSRPSDFHERKVKTSRNLSHYRVSGLDKSYGDTTPSCP